VPLAPNFIARRVALGLSPLTTATSFAL